MELETLFEKIKHIEDPRKKRGVRHPLKDYSVPRFCKFNDFCEESIYSYLKGKVPRSNVAVQVEKATQGEVTLEDLGVPAKVIAKIRRKAQKAKERREQARARKAAQLQENSSETDLQLASSDLKS